MKNKDVCQEKYFFLKKIRLFLEFWDCYQQVNTDGQFILSKTLRRVTLVDSSLTPKRKATQFAIVNLVHCRLTPTRPFSEKSPTLVCLLCCIEHVFGEQKNDWATKRYELFAIN
jgi:hypothetical protein